MIRKDAVAVAISVFLLGAFAPLNAETKESCSDAVTAIAQLENESVKASLGNPRQFLQKNLAEDFVGGTSFGKWEVKAKACPTISFTQFHTRSGSPHWALDHVVCSTVNVNLRIENPP